MFKHTFLKYIYFLGILFLLYFEVELIYLILYVFFVLNCIAIGAFSIRFNYFLKAHHFARTSEKKIALTFDDGPTEYTLQVLDLLEKYKAKATFFCIGNRVAKLPEIVKLIEEKGHTIGNHSYSHANTIGFFSTQKMIEEITSTEDIIFNTISKKTNFYRPPFGVTNPNIARALKKLNYEVIGWNVRSLDTVIKVEKKLFNRVKSRVKPGAIVLLHDTSLTTITVLERLLNELQKENYNFVTVNELLSLPAYK